MKTIDEMSLDDIEQDRNETVEDAKRLFSGEKLEEALRDIEMLYNERLEYKRLKEDEKKAQKAQEV